MTKPMPRCSCGCGERLTEAQVLGGKGPWTARSCLQLRRPPAKKVKDGEAKAVAMRLVPAPQRATSRPTTATGRPRKRGNCDTCGRWRNVRPMGTPDAQVMLCKECVP